MENQEIITVFKEEFLKKVEQAKVSFKDDFISESSYIEFFIDQDMQDVMRELDIDENKRDEIEQDIKDQAGYDMYQNAIEEINDIISANYKNLQNSDDELDRLFYKAFEEAKQEKENVKIFVKFASIISNEKNINTWYIEQNDLKEWHHGRESIADLCYDYLHRFATENSLLNKATK
jgi:hypothetical protein